MDNVDKLAEHWLLLGYPHVYNLWIVLLVVHKAVWQYLHHSLNKRVKKVVEMNSMFKSITFLSDSGYRWISVFKLSISAWRSVSVFKAPAILS